MVYQYLNDQINDLKIKFHDNEIKKLVFTQMAS